MPYSLLKPPKRELILEFKGSIRYVRKRHPTLVTKVDLIPQPQWKLKILEAIGFNRLSSFQTLSWYNGLVYSFLYPLGDFENA